MDGIPDTYPGQVDVLEMTLEHVTAIASPARSEVFWAFHGRDPRSALDVARQMGKPAATVHYHVNELVRVGLLIPVSSLRSGARTERLYVHAGRTVLGKGHPMPDEYRVQAARGLGAILRIFARERATLHRVLPFARGLGDYCTFSLLILRLKPEVGLQLKADVSALIAKYRALEDPDGVRVRMMVISHPDKGEIKSAYKEATGYDLSLEKATEDL